MMESQAITGLVTDFDWKLNIIVASDSGSQIRRPLLQLALHILGKDEPVTFEFAHDELSTFIDHLTKIISNGATN